ncbi:hypothetical protein [Bartonella apis]|uniref:hypothetical protein n=1 Tax=Bartonella apis TaxID=1686310 RepID=UPI00242AAB60|nr:hypothetical protein [Bartonella apis]MCT6824971.1 hypothetical protein [Bartonella apis]MCT6861770.1 hypothetical protein [Bartonella apis]
MREGEQPVEHGATSGALHLMVNRQWKLLSLSNGRGTQNRLASVGKSTTRQSG